MDEIKKMTCAQLKKELAKAGLDRDGKKAELVERLYEAHTKAGSSGTEGDGGAEPGMFSSVS